MENAIYHDILYRLGKPQLTDAEYDKKFGVDIVFHNRVKSFLKSKDKNKILDYINKFFIKVGIAAFLTLILPVIAS